MARWVTIKLEAFPIDYKVPTSGAWLHFKQDGPDDTGERYLPDDQADFMIKRGYGVEGKLAGSSAKSRKGKTAKPKAAKKGSNAKAAHPRSNASLADAPVVAAGSPGDRDRLDQTSR
jgi:hypothetical protein